MPRPTAALPLAALLLSIAVAHADITPTDAAAFFDFHQGTRDLAADSRALQLHGPKVKDGQPLEFTDPTQYVEMTPEAMAQLSRQLDGIKAISVGGWFLSRRSGEQTFFSRGSPQVGPLGERLFRRNESWVNFCLGTDEHGFFLGNINGNGSMPFPHVTINEVRSQTWNQLVVVKDADGYEQFYQNGTLIHTDRDSCWSVKAWPFRETGKEEGAPVRLAVPQGGLIGEAWIFAREISAEEIRKDYLIKRQHYKPAPPGEPIALREMHTHPEAGRWHTPIDEKTWPAERERLLDATLKLFGPFPKEKVPLDPKVLSEEDCGHYVRRKVSLAVQPEDRMPAYLLIPKKRSGRVPAIICFYGTTGGAGKETTVGLSGSKPGSPPEKNRAFAVDMVEAGFVAFAADYLRDGERIVKGDSPYDTKRFYEQFPDWSIHGKDVWDTMRAIDYLQALDFVDGEQIGMVGHSYGGHSTIFTAALEPRIKAAVANGPVSAFREHGMHWAVPKGGRSSQSLPAMRPYILDPDLSLPLTFGQLTALVAPRPLLVGQAVGEHRPTEEENYATVMEVYRGLGHPERVRYHWYAGDHDFPLEARKAAVDWFRRWLSRE